MHCRDIGWLVPIGLLLGTAPAWASSLSFSVEPMTTEISARPGAQQTGVITVTHELSPGAKADGIEPIRLRAYAQDWSLNRKGEPQFQKPAASEPGEGVPVADRPGSCSNWLQINPVELCVPAGEARQVRYTVNVPAGAAGTFRTIIMFESAPEPSRVGPRVVAVNARIGSTLYVQVGPQAKRARITQFGVTKDLTTLTLENTGTSQLRLQGMLQFRDASGRMVQQVALPGAVLLPGQDNIREFTLETPRLSESGTYEVTALLDYGGDVLIGARAHVTLP